MTEQKKPTLLVIDGHSLAFRAFFALPVDSFQTQAGQHTNAIHGFISMLLSILKAEQPTHIAVAFDISRYSFRTREYPDYKGTRGETPAEFIGQVPLLQEALAAMNITTLTKEDYEADDILATLATRGADAGYDVLVVSGDRDTIQLVTDDVTLLYPASQGVSALKRYTPDAVVERYGIRPEQYPDVAALVGESSDNLIGISKVGEKTAVKWLGLYGSLDGILEHADEIPGVVGNNLREQRENAIRNRRLNALVRTLELDVELDELAVQPINAEAVNRVFTELEFRTLKERVLKLGGAGEASTTTAASSSSGERAASGRPNDTSTELTVVVPDLPPAQELLDEELAGWFARTSDPIAASVERIDGQVVAIGLASTADRITLNWSPKSTSADYRPLLEWLASDRPKVLFDAKPQLKSLFAADVVVGGPTFDALIAAQLRRPQSSAKSFAEWVTLVLQVTMPVADPNQLVPDESVPGGPSVEAWFALQVWEQSLRDLADGNQLHVLDDIEVPVTRILAEMESRGVAVDRDRLVNLSSELETQAAAAAADAFAALDWPADRPALNLASPKQLQEVLFDELELPKTRATKTGYTTDAAALADLLESLDGVDDTDRRKVFLTSLLRHRDVTKLRQIVETLVKAIGADGRIHTSYGQIGAATGRLSSNDPNLQNIPVRSEDGRRIREAFIAGEGFENLLTADYSQIEMRIMAHLSQDPGLIEAFNVGEDLHRYVGARIFGVDPADVSNEQRSQVKAMSYGLVYGLSAFGLSKQLRISQAQAKQLMADYFARFGAVREYLRSVVEQARQAGYTETIDGRRRPFPDLASPNRVLRENAERAALNAPIQGTAADLMKRAMILVDQAMTEQQLQSRMLLQVHDELIFEVAPGERDALEALVRTQMDAAADLLVPLEVHVGVGANWDSAAH